MKRETGIWPTYSFGNVSAVLYCKYASSPEDLAHGMQPGPLEEMVCVCGKREMCFERIGPYWWPVRLQNGVPHFIVPACVTRGVDDPRHAPRALVRLDDGDVLVAECICGFRPGIERMKALPAH